MAFSQITPPTVGTLLTSATYNQLVDNLEMGTPTFTNEAARAAAIPSPTEGQVAYLTASTEATATGNVTAIPTGIRTFYNGSGWVTLTEVGAHSSVSATTTSVTYVTTLTGDATAISVTLRTGTGATVGFSTRFTSSVVANVNASVSISGATTLAAASSKVTSTHSVNGAGYTGNNSGVFVFPAGVLTSGINTFTLNYSCSVGTTTYLNRALYVRGST